MVYRKVKEELVASHYVLFSGTPCLVAGLYGYLGKSRNNDRLYTIDQTIQINNYVKTCKNKRVYRLPILCG